MKVDFHSHTHYSSDSLTPIQSLIDAARRRGLDRIVVTDHNSIHGALEAHALAPDLVIVGEEVQTTQGEFLAAFVKEVVPKRLEPAEALARLKAQGAFISISHPFDAQRSGWPLETLEWLAPQIDAVEVLNARVVDQAITAWRWRSPKDTACPAAPARTRTIPRRSAGFTASCLNSTTRTHCARPSGKQGRRGRSPPRWCIFIRCGRGSGRAGAEIGQKGYCSLTAQAIAIKLNLRGAMAESADATDLKSVDGDIVRVRPPLAPLVTFQ